MLFRSFLLLVPEQFTMQTQRELVWRQPNHAIMNVDVLSFVRLAYRIFGETGTASLPVLDDMGKTMILHKVLLAKEKELPYFGKNVHKKGYVAQIKSFLSFHCLYRFIECCLFHVFYFQSGG